MPYPFLWILYVNLASHIYWGFIPFCVYVAAPLVTGALIVYIFGDDAYQKSVDHINYPFTRFSEIIPNVIYDTNTGLYWIGNPAEIGGFWGDPLGPTPHTWDEFIAECNSLNYGGFDDWRMPNSKEMQSIVDYGTNRPAVDSGKFKSTKDEDYFSGTITNWGCQNYFQTDFTNGGKSWDQDRNKKKYARPVRGKPKPLWEKSFSDYQVPKGTHRRGK